MYKKLLIYIIYIYILYIQNAYSNLIYTYDNITDYNKYNEYTGIYSKYEIKNKSEILKITDTYNLSYLCKNDICVRVRRPLSGMFIKIPNEEGNEKLYITNSCYYENGKITYYKSKYYNEEKDFFDKHTSFTNECINTIHKKQINCISDNEQVNNQLYENCYTDLYISYKCTSDSQCLTNKCINGFCIYNKENPTEFCTYIYSISVFYGRHSYMHCGRMPMDVCKTNKECASKECTKYGYCERLPDGPSEADNHTLAVKLFILFIIIIIFIVISIILCLYCCIKLIRKKSNKKKE